MADMYLGAGAGTGPQDGPGAFSTLFNWMGALMSVALVAGLAVWGYQLAMRDVTGVPVVRALEGPMRVAPDDPGGQRAAHQGLAVNSVAAEGGAAAPADRLVLAPSPIDLTDEDLPRPALAGAETGAASAEDAVGTRILTVADRLAEGSEPLAPLAAEAEAPAVQPAALAVPPSVGGVSRSPLPAPRPALDLTALAVATDVAFTKAAAPVEVAAAEVPAGARLVQFGAFDSPEAARAEWAVLDGRFRDFLAGKKRVIQEAVSGGKTFWRLRAMGFADISDARRFCSALVAERQACIPVVNR